MEKKTMNNQVTVRGTIVSELKYSHEVMGEKFYEVFVGVKRHSGTEDRLPVLVSERLWDVSKDHRGEHVTVEGQYRSQNLDVNGNHKLVLHVFARSISTEKEEEIMNDENQIVLNGYICKRPNYRTTPLGREICDVLLAVNREYGKSDYIPCILWGRAAKYVAGKSVGEQLQLTGRIQSRAYTKVLEDAVETRIAYEVSAARVESVKEAESDTDLDM